MHKLKAYTVGMPKVSLALFGIGMLSLMGALVLVASNNTPRTDLNQLGSNTNSNASPQVLGAQTKPGVSAANQAGSKPGSDGETHQAAPKKASGGAASSSSAPKPAASSPSTSTPSHSGYNLNENWYLATAGAEGLFNTCWPTELTESNEAGCIDESNPYSHYWFEGVGVSKSAEEAQALAAAQVNQKASDKHVDLRRGGGGDAVILTGSLCASYGLVCGRW